MQPKQKIRIVLDLIMTALLPVLMAYQLVGQQAHEWLGLAMLALFLLHHLLNARWFGSLRRGRWTGYRLLQTVLDAALLADMLALGASGAVLGRYAFDWPALSGGLSVARVSHMLAAYWGFVVMSMHLGLHGSGLLGLARRAFGLGRSPLRTAVLRLLALTIALYGVFSFGKQQLAEYLFLRTQFVFFDYQQPAWQFFAEYLSMLCLFAFVGYYLGRLSRAKGAGRE